MNIDHVTIHLHSSALHTLELTAILRTLGFKEVAPDLEIEKDWDVRWFEPDESYQTILHLVADDNWSPQPVPGLSHFCITGVGDEVFGICQESTYCEHYTEGSKRVWINYHGLRIEVRA